MDFVVYQRRRQLIGLELLGTIAFRFILVAAASVILIKLVSVILAHSPELHTLELLSSANNFVAHSDHLNQNGSSGGGER